MFFFLSKTLNYLTKPVVIIIVLFVLSVVLRNATWRKRLFWSALMLLLFFTNDFIANEVMRSWEVAATPYADVNRHYAVGIVLTGVTMSTRAPHDRVYFQKGADRVVHTFQLYKLGKIKKILVSGGSGRLLTAEEMEADQLKKAFILMGVPETDLIIENLSRNTHESALQVKRILGDSIQASDCLLVTSAFHIRRSRACFQKQGMDMDTFSADFHSHPREFTLDVILIPKVEALVLWQILMKEWVGVVAYKIAGYI